MRDFQHVKNIFFFLTMLSLIFTTLAGCSSGPENELEGEWAWDRFSSNSEKLMGDLNFGEGKSLTVSGLYAANK